MIRFADMFCGGGLGARGAVDAGAVPALAIDAWDVAAATYADNFPGAKVLHGRTDGFDPADYCPDGVDLLLTSPECTNHSPAKGARPRCEASRRTAFDSVEWIKALRPRWIVMENVPQMKNWNRFSELASAIRRLGYYASEQIFDASRFGVPQVRRRLFVVFQKGKAPPQIPEPTRRRIRPASEILDAPGTWATTPLSRQGRARPTLRRADAAIAALGKRKKFLLVYYGSDGGGGWQRIDSPLRTITTLDRFALVEPTVDGHTMRMLQPNELARAMGLKPSHKFNHGTRRDKVKLCGNGVCAPVMEFVVQKLILA